LISDIIFFSLDPIAKKYTMSSQKCVHQSCGKVFTDLEEECTYHPGPPVFHEGQKGKKLSSISTLKGRRS